MEKNKTALFFKTKNIGDSIILTSAIAALPEEYEFIDVLCLPESKEIFLMCPRVRNVFIVPRHLMGFNKWIFYFNEIKKILSHQYDFVAHFSTDWRGAFFTRFLNPPLSVGIKNNRRNQFWHRSFTVLANVANKNRLAVEQDVDLLRRAGLYQKAEAPPYRIVPPMTSKYVLNIWLKLNLEKNNKSKIILIYASSRWKFKELKAIQWQGIIDSLSLKNNIIILSGSRFDINYLENIVNLCNIKPLIKTTPTLYDAASLIELSDLVISIDSMAVHMASALKKPVLPIFGPTDDKTWAPWKVKYKILALNETDSPSFGCRPCRLDGCGGSKVSQCLHAMPRDYVVKNTLAFLKTI
jgi:heptosyltransferase-3